MKDLTTSAGMISYKWEEVKYTEITLSISPYIEYEGGDYETTGYVDRGYIIRDGKELTLNIHSVYIDVPKNIPSKKTITIYKNDKTILCKATIDSLCGTQVFPCTRKDILELTKEF